MKNKAQIIDDLILIKENLTTQYKEEFRTYLNGNTPTKYDILFLTAKGGKINANSVKTIEYLKSKVVDNKQDEFSTNIIGALSNLAYKHWIIDRIKNDQALKKSTISDNDRQNLVSWINLTQEYGSFTNNQSVYLNKIIKDYTPAEKKKK